MSEPVYGVVYVLTSPSGKQYVGQTRQPVKNRLIGHKAVSKTLPDLLISKVINKYGLENLKVETIDTAYDVDDLDNKEAHWIKTLNTMSPNGYNTRDVKKGHFTEDVRKKISESKTGHTVSRKTRDKIRKSINEYNRENGIEIKHGTTTGYQWYKCRCLLCKASHRDYLEEYSVRVLKVLEQEDHGSYKAYRVGCRCEVCKEFKSQKAKEYWNRRKEDGQGRQTSGVS